MKTEGKTLACKLEGTSSNGFIVIIHNFTSSFNKDTKRERNYA